MDYRMDKDKQNIVISLLVFSGLTALLWFSSYLQGVGFALAAVVFSFLGLTNYALIHEACHDSLHQSAKANLWLGRLCSSLFPVSFNFMKIAHRVHHSNNRTDYEMFDYYYPEDNLFIKYGQWYSILTGLYPPIIPIGSVLMALCPGLFWLSPWQQARSSSIIFNRQYFPSAVLNQIRLDVLLTLAVWLGLFTLLNVQWQNALIFYLAFWFNWSTRQYVTHAFTPRKVIDGALNLKVSRLMGWVLLNGHWDLVHHQYPHARWQDLPAYKNQTKIPVPFWPQYLKQWLGPRINREPAPAPLKVY